MKVTEEMREAGADAYWSTNSDDVPWAAVEIIYRAMRKARPRKDKCCKQSKRLTRLLERTLDLETIVYGVDPANGKGLDECVIELDDEISKLSPTERPSYAALLRQKAGAEAATQRILGELREAREENARLREQCGQKATAGRCRDCRFFYVSDRDEPPYCREVRVAGYPAYNQKLLADFGCIHWQLREQAAQSKDS